MSRELILLPKTKYELLNKPIPTAKSGNSEDDQRVACLDEKVVKTVDPSIDLLVEKTLTYAVPKNGQRKAMGLWNCIKDHRGTILDWNDHGEIVVNGQTIPHSLLIDLLRYAVTVLSNNKPLGYDQFCEALKRLHVPSGFMVQHQHGSGYSVRGKTNNGPPGVQNIKKNSFRWIPY